MRILNFLTRKSFAFRKGRSALDAHALIMDLLKEPNAPEWFLICDVKSCYSHFIRSFYPANIVYTRGRF